MRTPGFGQVLVGLLALQPSRLASVQAAVVEVDLVFPRNDTYRPGRIPFVFAVQNSAQAVPLAMHISWTLWRHGTGEAQGDFRKLLCDKLGDSDPFFTTEEIVSWNSTKTPESEGVWNFVWSVQSQNCTGAGGHATKISQDVQTRNLVFTTKKGAQEPDVLQGADACTRSPGITFNVTDTVHISAWENQGRNSCNILAPGPPPVANVCAIAMGPEVAAAANKTSPMFYCEEVGRTETSATAVPDNAAARGAPLWAADAGFVSWFTSVTFLLPVIGAMEILY